MSLTQFPKMTRFLLILAHVAIFSGCARISDDEAQLLTMAKGINRFPVQRTELITTLGLNGGSSEGSGGGIRSGHMHFFETWHHPSGLTVVAYDSEYVGRDVVITRESIAEILNDPNRSSTDFIGVSANNHPRDTFNGFSISKGDRVLYRSKNKQAEQ